MPSIWTLGWPTLSWLIGWTCRLRHVKVILLRQCKQRPKLDARHIELLKSVNSSFIVFIMVIHGCILSCSLACKDSRSLIVRFSLAGVKKNQLKSYVKKRYRIFSKVLNKLPSPYPLLEKYSPNLYQFLWRVVWILWHFQNNFLIKNQQLTHDVVKT